MHIFYFLEMKPRVIPFVRPGLKLMKFVVTLFPSRHGFHIKNVYYFHFLNGELHEWNSILKIGKTPDLVSPFSKSSVIIYSILLSVKTHFRLSGLSFHLNFNLFTYTGIFKEYFSFQSGTSNKVLHFANLFLFLNVLSCWI